MVLVNGLILMILALISSIIFSGTPVQTTPFGAEDTSFYQSLALYSLLWGMGGSVISLALSKYICRMIYGVQDVSEVGEYRELVHLVYRLAEQAGIRKMPEVGVYESSGPNAFATGMTRNSALVAVSTGLLRSMEKDEVEAVLAHEISHVVNGDMVTMTLLQGIVNAFAIFVSDVIARALSRRDNNAPSMAVYMAARILIQYVVLFFGSIVVYWFSRRREYRADAGSAHLVGKDKMIRALQSLGRSAHLLTPPDSRVATLQIAAHPSKVASIFSTHPSIEERIDALRHSTYAD